MSTTPLVIVAEDLDPGPSAWLAERCEVARVDTSDSLRFAQLLAKAQGLIVRTYTQVDQAMLDAAPNLRVVARAGVGLDNIDLNACWNRGIVVVHTPGANTRAVVEFVLACLLDALRPRLYMHEALDVSTWKRTRRELQAPTQLSEMTLGILGLGRIGSQLARAATALDMRVIYHDLRDIPPDQQHGAQPVGPEELFGQSDILSVHVDGRKTNYHLIDKAVFSQLKDRVIFINTSRGLVVDPVACAEFCVDHPHAKAILDVHDPEPIVATSPLLEIDNVYLSPHMAGGTDQAKEAMSWVVRDVWQVLCGQAPQHPALPQDN